MVLFKKTIAIAVVTAIFTSGCTSGSSSAKQLKELPLVDALSKKEVIDYYKEDLEIRSMVTKIPLQNREEVIEFRDIMDEEWPYVERELMRIEKLLASEDYTPDEYLTPQMHAYLKSLVDDKILTREGVEFKGASQEFYVVDVKYNVAYKGVGSLKDDAKYIGVHGVFVEDILGNTSKDEVYVSNIEEAVKKEIEAQRQKANNGKLSIDDIADRAKSKDGTKTITSVPIEEVQVIVGDGEDVGSAEIKVAEDLNISVYNNVLGSAIKTTSMIPDLDLIFTPSASSGNLSGYGIYGQGTTELREFDINRESLSGEATIRFVFRSDIGDNENVHIDNVYMKDFEIINGLPNFEDNRSIFPQFAEEAIKVQIDNADRARVNSDITAMASGDVYDDVRAAIYFGKLNKDVDVSRSISNVSQTLQRKDTNWLVEVENYQMEHSKYSRAGFGSWMDRYLVSLKQNGSIFVISDFMLVQRSMVTDIPLRSADSTYKRFTYLSLYGTIKPEDKQSIRESCDEFIQNVNTKSWDAMYNSFNQDVSMLSKTRRDYLYFMYRGWLNRRGTDQAVEYYGAISEWLGGSERQAEFMTMELANYVNLEKAQITTNYYLMSKFEDRWVIDEIRNMDTQDIEGRAAIEDKIQEIKLYGKGDYMNKIDNSAGGYSSNNEDTEITE